MIRKMTLALACLGLFTGAAMADNDPLASSTWKRSNGTLIKYSGTGGKYCGTVMTGEYKGKSIGCMNGSNGKYKGTVNKLDEGKTYSGKATVSGSKMTLSGCALGGLVCKSETLVLQ